ncbi:porin family protein [Chryseobacterium sp.]|uniref:porin family protein n=1 Tax=Chryseobacterium sp. TaxID=1871047 RepID=UPI0025B95073|nr:porin family protein [Chryseobacterium sp.]MBV8328378.1 PorT family protein [Chryseobacterium sp.]
MKKIILSALFLAISTVVSAQDSTINFGVKGGYSLSDMKFYGEKMDSKSYFYAGIVAEHSLSSKFGLQAEVLYTQLGGSTVFEGAQLIGNEIVNKNDMKFEYKLNQIQVPVSVKYYFVPAFSASVGMNFGFNISSKTKADTTFGEVSSDNAEGIKTLNLFPFLGAEYKINDKFFVDARYNFNFFEANKTNAVPTKIGFLQAGVGYRFN